MARWLSQGIKEFVRSVVIEIKREMMAEIERFVVILYDRCNGLSKANEVRKELFSKDRTVETIPPTEAALREHAQQSVLQGGYSWSQILNPRPRMPDFSQWGWRKTESDWELFWTKLQEAMKSCYELVQCSCKKYALEGVAIIKLSLNVQFCVLSG